MKGWLRVHRRRIDRGALAVALLVLAVIAMEVAPRTGPVLQELGWLSDLPDEAVDEATAVVTEKAAARKEAPASPALEAVIDEAAFARLVQFAANQPGSSIDDAFVYGYGEAAPEGEFQPGLTSELDPGSANASALPAILEGLRAWESQNTTSRPWARASVAASGSSSGGAGGAGGMTGSGGRPSRVAAASLSEPGPDAGTLKGRAVARTVLAADDAPVAGAPEGSPARVASAAGAVESRPAGVAPVVGAPDSPAPVAPVDFDTAAAALGLATVTAPGSAPLEPEVLLPIAPSAANAQAQALNHEATGTMEAADFQALAVPEPQTLLLLGAGLLFLTGYGRAKTARLPHSPRR